jgi:hypothetical protein
MDIDLPGRIRNTKLPHSHALLPLFEAIINSIHAVAESPHPDQGVIRVHIERDKSQQGLLPEAVGSLLQPVKSFVVSDNGIGFTDVNFKAFSTADTRQKANQGGKGIGRFLWLKAFDHAEIESTFHSANGDLYRRNFSLRLTTDGVEDHSVLEVSDGDVGTVVRLCEFKLEYQQQGPFSSEAIARRVVEHCLEHFVLGLAPAIYVHDSDSEIVYDLYEMFEEEVKFTTTVDVFELGGRNFQIHNLRVNPSYQSGHRFHFCANNRSVLSEPLAGKIPNLIGSLHDAENRPFLYAGYVSGDYLDEVVNSERTDFVMPDDDSMLAEPGWTSLLRKATEHASSFISPYTESVKVAKEQQISEFAQKKAPQYRPLVKHRRDLLDNIPPDLPDDKLDLELYRANQVYDSELREKSSTLLSSLEHGADDWVALEQQYGQFLEEWNEAGIAKLARHIVHRKATLDFLKASLRVTSSGKYQLESAIHSLVFPLKRTSDDVHADQMNLWILDEKLAYHYYLASDLPLRPSKDRPDILIFNAPAAFVNDVPPFQSIVLIEFKRPLRNDYTDDENPIAQTYRYVSSIKSGNALDRAGRPIAVKPDTPFYAYVVCDLTAKLRQQAAFASLVPTSDGLGFFGYNTQVGVYVEVMSFDKLVSDAERRNAALFDQLNLPRG